MGDVVAFPRKKAARGKYTAAALARVRETVERMMARGVSEDEAFEVAALQLRMEGNRGD